MGVVFGMILLERNILKRDDLLAKEKHKEFTSME
jgi:hypothetical protein